ncbi:ABC transporter permease [Clostridium tagluense]|uniref:ABC transporter permease n=1 Tax=Clostridium tagluense TaxID=360422 RepID=UPI001C0DC6EC|nr:FtsX-like permease family protein [Clostridium tagluense]MBU3127647.1 hypothetical protein [Clostridium tagluense]
MLNGIQRQLKFHTTSTVIIVISYIITTIFISVGISYLNENRNIYLDNNCGDTKKSFMISIKFDKSFQIDQFINYIVKKNYKYDIKTYSTAKVDDKDIVIWGHKFAKKPYWQANILDGNYFKSNGYSDKNVAVAGSDLKDKCFFENGNQYITLSGNKFSVIGFAGRQNRMVNWSNTIYMPMECLKGSLLSHLIEKSELQLLFLSNTVILNGEADNVLNDLKNQFNNINIIKIPSDDNDTSITSVTTVIMVSALIFIVSIVNIIAMTLFWILDKRKEIAVRKVLGFTDGDIIKLIIKEMLELGVISIFFSFMFQAVLNIFISNLLKINMIIEINNILISITVVLVSILITSIIPIKVILKVKLTEILSL